MILVLGGVLYLSTDQPQRVSGEGGLIEQAELPTVTKPPDVVGGSGAGEDAERAAAERAAEAQAAAEQNAAAQNAAAQDAAAQEAAAQEAAAQAAAEEEALPPAPADTTMYLSIPSLGLSGVPVVNDATEAGLTVGAGHVPGTGFPWEAGDTNTYIAGHRLGYPGTLSDHVFYYLPNLSPGSEVILEDSNGTVYTYQVTEIIEVTPNDAWVLNPVAGRDIVSLQTCIEDFNDYWTDGPNWFARYVVRADRVA